MEESIKKELDIIQEEISNIQKSLNNIQAKIGDTKTSSKEAPYQKEWDDLMSIKGTIKRKGWWW